MLACTVSRIDSMQLGPALDMGQSWIRTFALVVKGSHI